MVSNQNFPICRRFRHTLFLFLHVATPCDTIKYFHSYRVDTTNLIILVEGVVYNENSAPIQKPSLSAYLGCPFACDGSYEGSQKGDGVVFYCSSKFSRDLREGSRNSGYASALVIEARDPRLTSPDRRKK